MRSKASVEAFLKAETSPGKSPRHDFVFEDMLYREYRAYAFHANRDPVGIEAFRNTLAKRSIERVQVDRPGGKRWTWRVEEIEDELPSGKTFVHRARVPFSQERGDGPHFGYVLRLNEDRSWVREHVAYERVARKPVVVRKLRVLRDVHYLGDTLKAGSIVSQLAKRKSEEHRPDAEEVVIEWQGIRRWIDAHVVCAADSE